jgi:transcriptional regulator with XRE-family HTH domain
MSQEAFADLLGVHRTYMGAIERGERNLTLQSVERLAARLGTTALNLLTADVAPSGRAGADTTTGGAHPDQAAEAPRRAPRRGRGRP